MRKGLWMAAAVALASVGGYWCFEVAQRLEHATKQITSMQTVRPTQVSPHAERDAGEDSDEGVEPLQVGGCVPQTTRCERICEEALARVVLSPGMQLPPRPDAQDGTVLRMPYADEEEEEETPCCCWQALLDFVQSLYKPLLSSTRTFTCNHGEESESTDVAVPTPATEPVPEPTPETDPIAEYHRNHPQHCPYHGGCPYPYQRR